jgi:hypothetical protein
LRPESDGLAGVLAVSNRLILHYGLYCGYDVEDAPPIGAPPPELAKAEEAAGGIDFVLQRAFAFIEAASGSDSRKSRAA